MVRGPKRGVENGAEELFQPVSGRPETHGPEIEMLDDFAGVARVTQRAQQEANEARRAAQNATI